MGFSTLHKYITIVNVLFSYLSYVVGLIILIYVIWSLVVTTKHPDQGRAKAYNPPENTWIKNKRILCIVNPHGGNKDGLKAYHEVVKVMFEKGDHNCQLKLITTEHAGHCSKVAAELALDLLKETAIAHSLDDFKFDYDAVLLCSGDGMLHEYLNGFLSSVGEEKAMQLLPLLPISLIPTGTVYIYI